MTSRSEQDTPSLGAGSMRGWLAWSLFAACVGFLLVAGALDVAGPRPLPDVEGFSAGAWAFAAAVVGFALVGALITTRVAGNRLGWYLTGFALLMATSPPAYQYSIAGLPGWEVAAWLNAWLWIVPIGVLAEAMVRFPDGQRPSRIWRWVSYSATTGIVASVLVGVALWPQRGMTLLTVGDHFPGIAGTVAGVALPLVFGSFVAATVALVVRQRRADPEERLQLRWVTYAVAVIATGLVAFAIGDVLYGGAQPVVAEVLGSVGILAVPLSMWIAISRHRLYEIDRLISRTVTYALLSAVLLGVYAAVAVVPSALLDISSDLLVAAATLAASGVFQPLRRRVQAAVDQRFDRTRYDAARTVDRFVARLRAGAGLTTVVNDMAAVIGATVHPASVSVWVRPRADARHRRRSWPGRPAAPPSRAD